MIKPIAICAIEDARLPALFFDKIFDLCGSESIPDSIQINLRPHVDQKELERLIDTGVNFIQKEHDGQLKAFLYSALKDPRLADIRSQDGVSLEEFLEGCVIAWKDNNISRLVDETLNKFVNSSIFLYQKACLKKGIPVVPFFNASEPYDGYKSTGNEEYISLELTNIPLIDATLLSWDHIIELRNDPNFREKSRNLRLLFAKNYKGKSSSYILDSLNHKIYEYEKMCKQYQLEIVLGTCNQLLNSKSLLGSLGLVTLGILTGNSGLIDVSVVAGSIIEIGKMTVHVIKKKLEFGLNLREHDVALLMDLKKKKILG